MQLLQEFSDFLVPVGCAKEVYSLIIRVIEQRNEQMKKQMEEQQKKEEEYINMKQIDEIKEQELFKPKKNKPKAKKKQQTQLYQAPEDDDDMMMFNEPVQ